MSLDKVQVPIFHILHTSTDPLMLNRIFSLSLGLLMIGGLASVCAQPYERTVRDTVAVGEGPVTIENDKGSITVSTWDRNVVAYRARIASEQVEEAVAQTQIAVGRTDGTVSLTTNYDEVEAQWTFGPTSFGYIKTNPPVHYTVRMPASTSLRVDDHESDIDVSGLSGTLRIETHEGSIRVTDQTGRAEVSSHEGRMVLREIDSNLIVDTHEGAVTVEGLRGRLDLQTHEGRAEVRIDALREIVAETHEGTVSLSMPASAGFDLSTDIGDDATLQGNVDLSSVRREENDYQGAVHGGGPLVRLTSGEGQITLQSR